MSFEYNSSGLRTKKVVGDKTTEYYYSGNLLVAQYDGTYWVRFVYSPAGEAVGFTYGEFFEDNQSFDYDYCYYVKNAQGDIVGFYSMFLSIYREYSYDAWGNVTGVYNERGNPITDPNDPAFINPLRYRGYYYDDETGLYYLNSRYYNPEWGTFICADTVEVATASLEEPLYDKSLYAYCDNNPIARIDTSGYFWEAIGIGFAVGFASQYVNDVIENYRAGATGFDVFRAKSEFSDYLASGIGGAVAAIPGFKLVGTMMVGAAESVISDCIKGNINSLQDAGVSVVKGAFANGLGYGFAKAMSALLVKKINNMPRFSRKTYLRDNIYLASQAKVNANLHTFDSSSFLSKMKIVEDSLWIFKSCVYSTIMSTFATLF